MEHLFTSESIISFFILVILEVVLGIDNVIFVSIIMNRLKTDKRSEKSPPDLDDHRYHFKKSFTDGIGLAACHKKENILFLNWWKRI